MAASDVAPTNLTSTIDQGVSAPSIEDRMMAFLKGSGEPAAPADDEGTQPQENAAPQDAPADPEQPDGLTDADLPGEEAAAPSPGEDAFDIVHDGKTVKLSRAELIAQAQQGFDYTQKTQALAAKATAIGQAYERAAAVEQLAPLVAQDLAAVKFFEAQLQQFDAAIAQAGGEYHLATSDPLEWPKVQVRKQQLLQGYQQARNDFEQKTAAINEARRQMTAQQLQQEARGVAERIPEWTDPKKYADGARELHAYLVKRGVPQEFADNLDRAVYVEIGRKAMLYDKLVAAKNDKSKQLRTVPPVSRPGAPSQSAVAERAQQAQQKLRKSHSREDAVDLLLARRGLLGSK